MDTLKILLGATMALLIGALVAFFSQMNNGMKNSSKEELTQLRRQLTEMEQEMQRLQLAREQKMLQEISSAPSPTDAVTREEVGQAQADIEERMKQLEKEAEEAKQAAERAEKEAEFLTGKTTESRDKVARRVRVINDAMLIATVKEWVEDPNFGGFAVLQIESQDNVQAGSVLAIRRNGGILGKLRVGEVTIEGAVANPVTEFNEVKPQPGDELILDEIVQLAN